MQESILRLYSVPDSLANATKHSAEVLASLAILGASHGAAQWLTPWRDLSIKRDCTELGHYDPSDDESMIISTSSAIRSSHGHVMLNRWLGACVVRAA